MSAVTVSSFRANSGIEVSEISGAIVARKQAASTEFAGVRMRSISHASIPADFRHLRDFVVARKLKGFVANTESETWRVIFVVDGKEVPYDLPGDNLRKAGIEVRYQPFEMTELRPISPHLSGRIYRFRPLAKTSDAQLETLSLDAERQRKYDLILGRFGKTKD